MQRKRFLKKFVLFHAKSFSLKFNQVIDQRAPPNNRVLPNSQYYVPTLSPVQGGTFTARAKTKALALSRSLTHVFTTFSLHPLSLS